VLNSGSILALAFVLPAAAVAGLLLWTTPLILLLAGGGVCAAAIVLLLLQRPPIALQVALFFYLFPIGLRPVEIGFAQDVVTNGALALAICAWMLHALSQRRPVLWNGVYFLFALYIVWASVTLLWAPDLVAGRKLLVAYCIGLILLFLIVQQVRTLAALDGIMRVLAIIGWIMLISGALAVILTGYKFGDRLQIFNVNENTPVLYLVLTLPGVIWPVLRSSGTSRRFYMALSFVFILCTLIIVLLTGSRGGALSLIIMLLAFSSWKPLRPWGIGASVLVACTLAGAPFLLDSLSNRANDDWGNEVGGRNLLWIASLQLIADHPLIGVGVGNGPFELTPYIAALTSDFDTRNDLPSHNPLLEVSVDSGLIGLLIYVSILVNALWQFFRYRGCRYVREGPLAAYFPMVLCIAAAYFVAWSKDGGLESHSTFFMLLALLIIPSQLLPSDGLNIDSLVPPPCRKKKWPRAAGRLQKSRQHMTRD
jgi:putative inorganic carbon (HCO3(-)) transporter